MAALVNTRDTILRVSSPRTTTYGVDSQIALINSTLADIASDTKITAAERQALRKEWDQIIAEYVNNSNQGLAYLGTLYPAVLTPTNYYAAYTGAVQTLANYLNNGSAYTLPSLGSSPTDAPNWISNANLSNTTPITITSSTFRANWKDVYDKKTALVNKATDEAGKVANWTGVTSRPYTFRVSARGYSSTQHQLESGLYNGETGASLVGAAAFWRIAKINRSTGAVTDVYGGNDATAFVSALNGITGSGWIVVVFTYDEPQWLAVNFSTVRSALYAHGASRAILGSPNFAYRCAYILVGISNCAEGNGFEAYNGVGGSGGSNDWCEVSFYLQNSNLVISGSAATPRTLADYSYTGALNATYGATWGSNIASQPNDYQLLNAQAGGNLFPLGDAYWQVISGEYGSYSGYTFRSGGIDVTNTAFNTDEWVTVSCDMYIEAAVISAGKYGCLFLYCATSGGGWTTSANVTLSGPAGTWTRVSASVQLPSSLSNMSTIALGLFRQPSGGDYSGNIWCKNIQVERGRVATAYTPMNVTGGVNTTHLSTSSITQAVSISTSYKNNGNSTGATTKTTQQLLGTITTSSNGDGRVLIFLSGKPAEESVYNYNGWGQILSQSGNGGNWLYLRILKVISGTWYEVYRREFSWSGIYNRYIYESANVFNDSPGAGVTVSYYYDIYSVSDYTATHVHYINALTGTIMEVKK